MENDQITIEQLNTSIQEKRDEMVRIAHDYGFNDEKTLKCSHELDQLLNIYQKMVKK